MTAVKVAVPDMVSNSYFAAIAAVELGFFENEGLNATHELIFPNFRRHTRRCATAASILSPPGACLAFDISQVARGQAPGRAFPGDVLAARHENRFDAVPGDVSAVKGRRIGAAPMVELGLKQLLAEAGVDLDRDE